MNIFFVIVGVSVAGIGLVVWLLFKEKKGQEETVETFPLESLKEEIVATPKLKKGLFTKESAQDEPAEEKKKLNPFAKLKLSEKKKEFDEPASDVNSAEPPGKAGGALGKLKTLIKFKGIPALKKKKLDVDDLDAGDEETASKNPLNKILSKLKFGKKKDEFEIPQATNFSSLKEKLNQFSKGSEQNAMDEAPLPLIKDKMSQDTGTISLKTIQKEEVIFEPKTTLSEKERQTIDEEVNSATELAELKSKYSKMEKIMAEKNAELDKFRGNYDSEIGHRKDFNKVKDLLEKELKEVKDRVKSVRQDLQNAVTEKESQQKRIKVLEDKSTKLEKEIASLEKENDVLRKKMKQAGLKEEPKRAAELTGADESSEPMELPPAFKDAASRNKATKDDISKFEESLGFGSETAATDAGAANKEDSAPAAPKPPAAMEIAIPESQETISVPKIERMPPPSPSEEPPEEPDTEEDDGDTGGFLKLSPDPVSDPDKPKAPPFNSPEEPEKKE